MRRELADWIEGPFWRLASYIDYGGLAATWFVGGLIVVVEDPGAGEISGGVFVLRGSW